MTDNYLAIRENNRRIVRGGNFDDTLGRWKLQIGDGETILATLDLTDWLGDAEITAIALDLDGVSVTEDEEDGLITLTASAASGNGNCDMTITCDDGRIRVERFRFEQPNSGRCYDGYTCCDC